MILDVKNLSVKLLSGMQIASLTSFRIQAGETVGWMGPSGIGKTTLLRALVSKIVNTPLVEYSISGIVNSKTISRVGYQSQRESLVPWISVGKLFSVLVPPESGSSKLEYFRELLESFEIGGLLDRFPDNLSGGEYQRCSLAAAFLTRPELIVLDEPLTEVDVALRVKILDFILRTRRSSGNAMLITSHDIDTIAYLSDRLICFSSCGLSTSETSFETRSWANWNQFSNSTEHRERVQMITQALGL